MIEKTMKLLDSISELISNTDVPEIEKCIQEKVLTLHGPSMFAVKAKIYGVLYNQASSIAFDETSSYWSALKSS